MVQTVIFDLDGTLLDTLEDLADAGNWVCRRNGWPEFTTAEFQDMVGHGMSNLVHDFSPLTARSPLLLAATLAQFTERYGAHKLDKTTPYPGITELLTQLKGKGIQLAVYSNKVDGAARALITHFFGDTFDAVRGKLPGVPVKPDPTGLHQLLQTLHADPATTILVGDSDVDVCTGHNAQLAVCGVTWGFRDRAILEREGADYLVDTTQELADLILNG